MSRNFQRTIESFTCVHCGLEVEGNGYTNHCPRCLWSLHVDIKPGDREESCRGAMEPVGAQTRSGAVSIFHRCSACGEIRKVKSAAGDNFEVILKLLPLGVPNPRHG